MQARKDKVRLRVQRHRANGNKEDKEQVRKRVEKYRDRWGNDNWNEKSREGMKRYRERWGWNNKNEQLGSGRLSPKRNSDFTIELKLIQWEKRRLGIK